MRGNADAFAQLAKAMHARCAAKLYQNSLESARFSPKNRAHFRRATHHTINKITKLDASSRYAPSIDRAHVLQSLGVRGAPILRET